MNRFLNVVFRESPLDSPFMPKAKCSGAGGAGAVAADLLGGLAGSLINFFASDNTDETNKWIARKNMELQRETNEQNYKMFQEQNVWNEDMWNNQNAYNLPVHQAARLRAAGINPAVLGSNASIPAGSVNSQSAPQFTAPQFNYKPITPVFDTSFIGQAINAFYDNQLKSAQTRNIGAATEHTVVQTERDRKAMSSYLDYLRSQAKKEGIAGDMAKRELDFFNAAYDTRLKLISGDANIQQKNMEMLDLQMKGVELDNAFKEIQNSYQQQFSDKQLRNLDATLQQIHAQIGLINANKLLTDEQRLHEAEKKVGQTIENGLKGINFNVQKEIKNSIIQSYKNSANIGMWEAFDKWKHNSRGDNRSVGDQFGVDYLQDYALRQMKRYHYIPKF